MVLVIKVQQKGSYRYIGDPSSITIIEQTDSPVVAGHIVQQSYGRGTFCLFSTSFDELMDSYIELHKRHKTFAEFVYETAQVRVINK